MAEVEIARGHCELLSAANCRQEDLPERGDIVELLKRLDRDIPNAPHTRVLDLNLHRHWNEQFLTALWYPHIYNGFKVDEIFLRYGKSKAEMDNLDRMLALPRLEGDSADFGSFPAHVHLSMGLGSSGFFYQLVIGPRAWPDYEHMVRVLQDQTHGTELFNSFRALEENGYAMGFGEQRLPGATGCESPAQLVELLGRYDHYRGVHWFGFRKDIAIADRLTVRSEELIAEIRCLYPAFSLVAVRNP